MTTEVEAFLKYGFEAEKVGLVPADSQVTLPGGQTYYFDGTGSYRIEGKTITKIEDKK